MHIPLHFANIALRGFYGMALREGVAAAVCFLHLWKLTT